MIALPPPEVVEWCRAVVAAADAARTATAVENLSGETIELSEKEMAERLGWTPGKLQKKRERLECEGLYRRAGRSILYSLPLTLRAFLVRSPDNSM
jgi:hypothetical protein